MKGISRLRERADPTPRVAWPQRRQPGGQECDQDGLHLRTSQRLCTDTGDDMEFSKRYEVEG